MNTEVFEEFSGSTDQTVVKGKRTKRPRPSYSATSSGGGSGGEIWLAVSSPATSTSTEEDEDMANCLILLARGGFPPEDLKLPPKFSSRKITEMVTTTDAKVGIYVYECKTCNRTFPSFQALGGHRASHKKPKSTAEIDRKKSPMPADDDREEGERKFTALNQITPPLSNQLMNKNFLIENKPKIHECSICGSEFASGQALGGHMRRHRSAPAPNTTSHEVSVKPTKNMLALDLNLPAPPEDDNVETNLSRFSGNRQPGIIFSAAALVDCHY